MNEGVVVLGLGNLLRRDEGLGVLAVQKLAETLVFDGPVRLIDGGTLGLGLLSELEGAAQLIVLDAVLGDGPPGSAVRLAGDEVPVFFGKLVSAHDIGLPDILAVMSLRGTGPDEVVVLGLVPGEIELGWGLSQPVEAALDTLVSAARDELARWGVGSSPLLEVVA